MRYQIEAGVIVAARTSQYRETNLQVTCPRAMGMFEGFGGRCLSQTMQSAWSSLSWRSPDDLLLDSCR